MARTEIIVVGREILTGRTLDTNSNWLAKRITALGGDVKRVTVVDDEIDSICGELSTALRSHSHLIVTTGGLGPTSDDKTLDALAKAAGSPMELNPQALDFVKGRYAFFKEKGFIDTDEVTPSREKMAIFPKGAEMLRNPVGAAPGVKLWIGKTLVLSLPGVPKEMKAIFEESLLKDLRDLFGRRIFREKTITTTVGDESKLGEILDKVMREIPRIYLKSRPTHFGKDVRLEVTLTATGDNEGEVEARIQEAISEIEKRLPH
ncbi:MAG: competence/damage-inducible protein A [Proteobacteria bacterium]|nr:competence/damage-inducible protein A [Pseudomonadota bacterium]